MGNCLKPSPKNSVVAKPLKSQPSQAVKDFKVSHSDLVKQKKTSINDDYTFIETLGRGKIDSSKHLSTNIQALLEK